MTTGERLKELRKKQGITQEGLADTLQVSRQSISKWESDAAFPETEKLIKMAELYQCSVDYILRGVASIGKPVENSEGAQAEQKHVVTLSFSSVKFEYKSKKTLFGKPLVHITWGHDMVSKGIIAIGLRAVGVLSVGLLSVGLLSFGVISIGLLALGAFALGLIAGGAIAFGIFAFGALAFGIAAVGACSFGVFSVGAAANGHYVGIGDYASGLVAIGKTSADGTIPLRQVWDGQSLQYYPWTADSATTALTADEVRALIDANVSGGWGIFKWFVKLFV